VIVHHKSIKEVSWLSDTGAHPRSTVMSTMTPAERYCALN
jgi:hypothetical protein